MDPATCDAKGYSLPRSDNQGLSPFFSIGKMSAFIIALPGRGVALAFGTHLSCDVAPWAGSQIVPAPRLAGVCGYREEMVEEAKASQPVQETVEASSILPGCEAGRPRARRAGSSSVCRAAGEGGKGSLWFCCQTKEVGAAAIPVSPSPALYLSPSG